MGKENIFGASRSGGRRDVQRPKLTAKTLVVGLGNPSPRFKRTHHNIRRDAVLALGGVAGADWKLDKRARAHTGEAELTYKVN